MSPPSLKSIFDMKITREGILLRSGKGENGLAWLKQMTVKQMSSPKKGQGVGIEAFC
jgi:hypothetical protein